MPSRYSDDPRAAFVDGNQLGIRDILTFEAELCTPYDPCLRFGHPVAVTPARLGPNLPAAALTGQDSHLQALLSLTNALPNVVEGQ
jgi:hypothetical protein